MVLDWVLPKNNYIKINVHAITFNQPLPNGNNYGIGIVIRDHTGHIILMVSGSLRNVTPMANELWVMLLGLRCAFYENKNKVELETESVDAKREWEEWRWFHDPNHKRVIDQLDTRKNDPNLKLDVKIIRESQNSLARFLAVDGAHNRTRLVVFLRPFGLVRDIWHVDMGLGLVNEDFDLLEERDYLQLQPEEIGDEIEGFGEMLVQDEGSANLNEVQ